MCVILFYLPLWGVVRGLGGGRGLRVTLMKKSGMSDHKKISYLHPCILVAIKYFVLFIYFINKIFNNEE